MSEEKSSQSQNGYLSASEAAQELGISLATLYSYVSRGLLRSETADARKRTRRYAVEDVQRLKERQELRQDPKKVVDTALYWGTPMMPSALTLIEGGRFYYRGEDVLNLAVTRIIEQVAALLWAGKENEADTLFSQPLPTLPPYIAGMLSALRDAAPLERCQSILPLCAAEDVAAYDFRPTQVMQAGARILRLMMSLMIHQENCPVEAGIAAGLQRAWLPDQPQAASLLNTALILCADHELNISSFTARCVASAGSSPYAVVIAGLAALQGVKHGGASARVEALFRETGRPERAHTTIAQRLRRGETLPGFGHRLYPGGDPRGKLLLERVLTIYPHSPGGALAMAIAEAAQTVLNETPNLDFGLVTLCTALELPPGTALALFALGRTIGWIGHAIEEYQADHLIRPRAHYTGILPHRSDGNSKETRR